MILIINPLSGRGVSKTVVGNIITLLCSAGYCVTVCFVGEHSAEELALQYAGRNELIVCVGGDGTFSGAVSGLMLCGSSIPIGYIPTGTANDIATTLSLPKDPTAAVKKLLNGKMRKLDIGLFAGRYFTYIAAFGAFTSVSYSTPQNAKKALGHFAYVLGGLAEVPAIKARHTVVIHDDGTIEGQFIFGGVANSTSVAGFLKLDPMQVDLDDGVFEIILVKQPVSPADFLVILAGIMTRTYDGDNVQLLHSSKVKFIFDEDVPWTIDGENGGIHREVDISNCHSAIDIIV